MQFAQFKAFRIRFRLRPTPYLAILCLQKGERSSHSPEHRDEPKVDQEAGEEVHKPWQGEGSEKHIYYSYIYIIYIYIYIEGLYV